MQTTTKKLEEFKIKGNIEKNLQIVLGKLLPSLNEIDCEYYISGGYALALLIAPRVKLDYSDPNDPLVNNELLLVNRDYYQDIDIFFASELDFWKAKATLHSLGAISMYGNENQSTYNFNNRSVQLVKKEFGTPAEIMKNFDFVNVSVFIDKNLNVITHKNFYKAVLQKELCLNHMKFQEIETVEEFTNYAGMQTQRILKYCTRYEWTIGPKMKKYIQDVINFYPQLTHSESTIRGSGSSSYVFTKDVNVWDKISNLGFTISK